METSFGFKETFKRNRSRAAAILGLLLSSQAAWSGVSVSPSPSYDGNYTVSFPDSPLGCHEEPSGYGFNLLFCTSLAESGSSTGSWSAPATSTSKSFTNKYAGTYYYQTSTTVTAMGQSNTYYSNVASVQVIRTAPDPNAYFYIVSGGPPHPSAYLFGWNATNAQDGCEVELPYFEETTGLYLGSISYSGLSSSGYVYVYDHINFYYAIDFVQAKVTCHGPGGAAFEQWHLDF